jgi:predicted nucleotidyltransferase component of viral defense system
MKQVPPLPEPGKLGPWYIGRMDPVSIRRLIIKALFSDDALLEQLVLKGGNALNLVHRVGNRSSLDIDLSLEEDFSDPEAARQRIFQTLKTRFEAGGFFVFDEVFDEVGVNLLAKEPGRWGGYEITFKVIPRTRFEEIGRDMRRAQIQALVTGPNQERNFTVHISRFEYCADKAKAEFDDYLIYVYTPAMIAFEKLRAICQQMPEYPLRRRPTPRARDFYDIHAIAAEKHVDFGAPESHELVKRIFEAKMVPLKLISRIREYREFHQQDWPQVQLAVSSDLKDFDYYFNFVLERTELLEPLWIE